ncbi:MAG: hypothetical protein U0941_25270 [Planctomycetaceae bacterium]
MANRFDLPITEAVAAAVNYYRYRGASLSSIDSYAGVRCRGLNAGKRDKALLHLHSTGVVEKRGSLWYLRREAFKTARGSAFLPEFQNIDFWVAFAVLGSGESCDLKQLIDKFDFVARTFPSFDELYGGINRLVAAGLVKTQGDCFYATELAQQLFRTAKQVAKKSIYDQLQAFTRLVLCPCCGVKLKRVTWRVGLTEKQISNAIREYGATFK